MLLLLLDYSGFSGYKKFARESQDKEQTRDKNVMRGKRTLKDATFSFRFLYIFQNCQAKIVSYLQ